MKSVIYFTSILLILSSCEQKAKKKETELTEYADIFGEWKVTHAEFLPGNNLEQFLNNDANSLESSSERYIYRFRPDSTFERGKPTVNHSNVEEAHGSFRIDLKENVMSWHLQWSTTDSVDTVEIEIVSISPIKMVLNEAMGGGQKMLQILERQGE